MQKIISAALFDFNIQFTTVHVDAMQCYVNV